MGCRMYVEEAIRDDNEVSDDLEDDIADLQLILGLGNKESRDIVQSVTTQSYRCSPCLLSPATTGILLMHARPLESCK